MLHYSYHMKHTSISCFLFQYVTDVSYGKCPRLPISGLNWNTMGGVDVPETEDSEDWKWLKKNPNWSSGSVSFSDVFIFATYTSSTLCSATHYCVTASSQDV